MKILTINVIGIPKSSSSDLIYSNVFQDYDAVIVNPESLNRLYDRLDLYSNRDENELKLKAGSLISSVNKKRHEEVNGLLQRGGVVVCFLQPLIKHFYQWSYEGEDHYTYVTNYDWLIESDDIKTEIKYSRGTTIDYIDSGHPFSDYLNIKPPWTAYVNKDACEDWKILASAFGTNIVSLTKRIGLGHIILLPSYYDHHNGELLEHCIAKLLGDKERRPQPGWAKDILVPGQEELISKITEVSDQIDALTEQRNNLINENDGLEYWKWLLYEKGKHQLEPVVRDALTLLGCSVEPQPDKDSDGVVTFENRTALLEVGGSDGTIRMRKLAELNKNMANYMESRETKIKGILVGNPFCDEPLNNRPPKESQKLLFAKELIESAEHQGITVLLSTDIYEIVSLILKDILSKTEKQSLRERIFNGKGLVRLV